MWNILKTTLFAPRDTTAYPPCGMFTPAHLTVLALVLVLVAVGVHVCKNVSREKLKKITKIVAVAATLAEVAKITYNLAYGYTWLDAWVPLAFCSLFIYATLAAGFGKGIIEKLGAGFLLGGSPTAGLLFLLFPTTSLQMHPIYHFLCIHSMLFHGAMLWLGLAYILGGHFAVNGKTFGFYAAFCSAFALPALILNLTLGCNMMFLREPFNIPLRFVSLLYEFSHGLYTVLIFCAYLACYLASLGVSKLAEYVRRRQRTNETEGEKI
ncbi:MAG: YwaF family protein [Clostridia bacterium]|nr:YwaF family protein [Clostridia bacterium]